MELNLLYNQSPRVCDTLNVHFKSEFFQKNVMARNAIHNKRAEMFIKRLFDIFVSSTLIICFSPILIITAILVKLSSEGSVFYSDESIGYRGLPFKRLKFRSMVIDERIKIDDYEMAIADQEKCILQKGEDDSRITWIGEIIRKTSVDELPQLFNVLFGDMSLIGPRPLVPCMLKHLPEFKEIRSLMRPGITGLWQIRNRNNNNKAEFMIDRDTKYVENYSLLLDLKILVKTPFVILTAKESY